MNNHRLKPWLYMRLGSSLRLQLLLIALCMLGCSFREDDTRSVDNRCSSNIDCEAGSECSATLNVCVASSEVGIQIALEVVATHASLDSGTFTWFSNLINVTTPQEISIILDPPVTVYGSVRSSEGSVPAHVLFSRSSAMPDLISKVEVFTADEPLSIPDSDDEADFVAQLAPGTYDVRVEPLNEAESRYPPRRFTLDIVGDLTEPILFEYGNDPLRFSGSLLANSTPVSDLQVRAVDRKTGVVLSTTTKSSSAPKAGRFEIEFVRSQDQPDSFPDFLLQVSAYEGSPAYPTLLVDPALLYPEPDPTYGYIVEVPEPKSSLSYRGRVVSAEHANQGVANAAVAFVSQNTEQEAGLGSVRITTTTDQEGLFEILAPPDTYEFVITPPSSEETSSIRIGELTLTGPVEGAPVDFMLPLRKQLRGALNSDDNLPMAGATVKALPYSTPLLDVTEPTTRYSRTVQTQTGELGVFELLLDIGRYDLVVQTLPESGFPWVVVRDIVVSDAMTIDSHTQEDQQIDLVAPIPLTGQFRFNDGSVASEADIIAHALIKHADGSQRRIEIGRTRTDTAGFYQLLLPASL